jgi:phage terminase small subunit
MSPKQVDKLKKAKYKKARLEGNSIAQSLRNAGYSEGTAQVSSDNAVVRQAEPELMAMVKASDITIDWVVNRLTQELVAKDAKASDRIRVSELLGKYLNMFKDSQSTQVIVFNEDITKDLPKLVITPVDVTQ